MSSNTKSKLRVAICGGGLGGLALACALGRAENITVDVYEAATEFGEIGAGISLRPRDMPILAELGLLDDILAINGRPDHVEGPAMAYYKADRPELELITDLPGQGLVTVHRAELHSIFFRHVPKHVKLHTMKRLISYSDSNDIDTPVRLFFIDGTEAMCDILVGADGIKSAVRATMLEDLASRTDDGAQAEKLRTSIAPRYSGATTFRGVIPRDRLTQIPPTSAIWKAGNLFTGDGLAIITYPISQGKLLNVAILTFDYSLEDSLHPHPWVSLAKPDDLIPLVDGWAHEPRHVVATLEGLDVKKWVINVAPTLDNWSTGRVTLLGDAAHAMTPFQGAGAGQAIEDAYMLFKLLAHPLTTREKIRHALRVYSDVRQPVALEVFHHSRRNGQLMSDSSMSPKERGAGIREGVERVWTEMDSPALDVQRAVDLFEKVVSNI